MVMGIVILSPATSVLTSLILPSKFISPIKPVEGASVVPLVPSPYLMVPSELVMESIFALPTADISLVV